MELYIFYYYQIHLGDYMLQAQEHIFELFYLVQLNFVKIIIIEKLKKIKLPAFKLGDLQPNPKVIFVNLRLC